MRGGEVGAEEGSSEYDFFLEEDDRETDDIDVFVGRDRVP